MACANVQNETVPNSTSIEAAVGVRLGSDALVD